MKVIVAGLRRSGTTIFWSMFRSDERLLCLNEPFNPMLRRLPEQDAQHTRDEFISLLERDGLRFWETFAPIHFFDELHEEIGERQSRYLRYLTSGTADWLVLTTRCHFKVAALHALAPDAVFVHLYRSPAGYATSHLLPRGGGRRSGLKRLYFHRGFWTRPEGFNWWGMEDIVCRSPKSFFAHRLRQIGMDPEEVYRLPAVGKLLAQWKVSFERVERDGRALFHDRFLSVSYEAFCEDPGAVVRGVYAAGGMEPPPKPDYSRVRPATPPFQPESPEWERLARKLGLPEVTTAVG